MDWKRRERLLLTGAPLAIVPAFAFLPALVYMVITPRVAHGRMIAILLFPILIAAEVIGISRLARCFLPRHFDLITFFALTTMLILVVIAIYTGLFLAAFAGRM
ncbi:MAG TPA: hypothetical protein VFA68_11360 [Terriglobales bacterium]|nr:hypothetical protein [Terriglobales bacterium]